MMLPNAEAAVVDRSKVVDYLLNPDHPDGGPKCAFFAAFGFDRGNWRVLASALRDHALRNQVARVAESPYGVRYSVDGPLAAADGRAPNLRTVWIVDTDDEGRPISGAPRLVTAHPIW